jgi:tRNA pseudouridine38-40 synthase
MVGEGVWPEARIAEVLSSKNRAVAGPTAPPGGLYFMRVGYEQDLGLS